MLEALNNTSGIVITDNSSMATWLKAQAQSYLSFQCRHAVVKQTEGKYHLIEFTSQSSVAVTVLKVVSYCSIILPLIAYIVDVSLCREGRGHKYYYDNPNCTQSAFMTAVDKGDLTTMKALYVFDSRVLQQVNERGEDAFFVAQKKNVHIMDWLLQKKQSQSQQMLLNKWLSADLQNIDMSPYLPRDTQLKGTGTLDFTINGEKSRMYTASDCVVDNKIVGEAMYLLEGPLVNNQLESPCLRLCYVINTVCMSPELFFDVLSLMYNAGDLNVFNDAVFQIYIESQDIGNESYQTWNFFNNEQGIEKVLFVRLVPDAQGETDFAISNIPLFILRE